MLEQIKILREQTHLSMTLCQKALKENNNDTNLAIEWLKKTGEIKKIDTTVTPKEGVVRGKTIKIADKEKPLEYSIVIRLNCQTDFAAKSEVFEKTVNDIIEKVPTFFMASSANFETELNLLSKQLGEAIQLSTIVKKRYSIEDDKKTSYHFYNHHNNKITIMLCYQCKTENSNKEQLTKFLDLCTMQIAANQPIALDGDSVLPAMIDNQKLVFQAQVPIKVKDQAMIDKIITGKMNKWYSENCLLEQESLLHPGKTIKQLKEELEKEVGPVSLIEFESFII